MLSRLPHTYSAASVVQLAGGHPCVGEVTLPPLALSIVDAEARLIFVRCERTSEYLFHVHAGGIHHPGSRRNYRS
jgi:hypothetical protein